ncbi:hypothetical protein ACFO4L_07635 [Bacillus daqingensis]|uniref:Uncharacterized protein n=1 Tax=Bacillus daqingensis TaxID=872396 RepID=A0ABV9NWL1_9BACI
MLTKQRSTAKELAAKWVAQQQENGRTAGELHQTMFVYGDDVMQVDMNENKELHITDRTPQKVVVFRKPEPEPGHICRCCSMEYDHEKDALHCCAYID